MKIIQIDGIRGLVTSLFIGVCLFAGFVVFPGLVAMHYWNKYLVNLFMFPMLNLFQGVLLWAIVAISYFILSKKGLAVSFKNTPELSDEELDMILKKSKITSQMKMMNKIISKSDKFDFSNKKDTNRASDKSDGAYITSSFSAKTQDSAEKSDDDKVSNLK